MHNTIIIATWNVNSINSRLSHLLKFLALKSPDIVLLQELKCEDKKFPYAAIEDAGYNAVVHGQKSYNGVAILSKYFIEDVESSLPTLQRDSSISTAAELSNHVKLENEARYIQAIICIRNFVFRIASVYVPHGQDALSTKFQKKLHFLEALAKHIEVMAQVQDEYFVLGGDINVAIEPIDVYDHIALDGCIGFHSEERVRLRNLLDSGLSDAFRIANKQTKEFSWWDYRSSAFLRNKGMRIDYLLLSASACSIFNNDCEMYKETRSWTKPSDHIPVIAKFIGGCS